MKSHLIPFHRENAFKYLLDQDESSSERNIIVNGVVDFNGSPHKNNKAYSIDLVYTQGTQNYNSKIGINIFPLPVGKYTIIMEYYFPEDTGVSLSCEASTAMLIKQTSKNFSDYTKLLVQFDQKSKDTPDYLYFNIRGRASTSTNPEGYLIFYGIKGLVDFVSPEIYDRALESSMFEFDNGKMKMNMDLDMNGYSMINTKKYFYLSGYYKKSKENIDNAVNFYSYSRNDYIALSNCVLVEVEVMVLSGAIDGRLYYDLKIGKVIYGKPNVENIIRNIRDRWNIFS